MGFESSLPFYPRRLLVRGLGVLGTGVMVSSTFTFFYVSESSYLPVMESSRKDKKASAVSLNFDLGLADARPSFSFPALDQEILVSFDVPRPDGDTASSSLNFRLKKTALSKKVSLPCRVDLRYTGDERIAFAEEGSSFWVELSPFSKKEIEAKVFVEGISTRPATFILQAQETPLFLLDEIDKQSPFRFLAEGRWWGRDGFCERYCPLESCKERIEVGSSVSAEIIEMKEGDWLAWDGEKWKKISSLEEGAHKPIAHIQQVDGKALIIEGWDHSNHFRFALGTAPSIPFKIRPDELISAIRVRSDKQISCMIDKQCMILKTGDWVFKGEGRWRILRKKEDRDALAAGKLIGEIFVFDKIEVKQGQKVIQGHLFNLSRSQSIFVDLPTQSLRNGSKSQERKSRMRPR